MAEPTRTDVDEHHERAATSRRTVAQSRYPAPPIVEDMH